MKSRKRLKAFELITEQEKDLSLSNRKSKSIQKELSNSSFEFDEIKSIINNYNNHTLDDNNDTYEENYYSYYNEDNSYDKYFQLLRLRFFSI